MGEQLPQGWVKTKLGKTTSKPQYGWTSKAGDSGKIKYLRTTDLTKGKVNWDTVPYCIDEPDDPSRYQVEKNDILISRAGSVGYSYRVEESSPNTVFASYLIRFRSILSEAKYIEYFLKSPTYWRSISEVSAGIAVQNINATKLSELEIPLAPLPEQKRIVAKLDALFGHLDVLKTKLDCIPELLKNFRQQVLTQAVTGKLTEEWRNDISQNNAGPFSIPKSWGFKKLSELSHSLKYGTSSKSLDEGDVPVLRMGNLQNGEIDWTDLKYSIDVVEIEKYLLQEGDVLFNRTNSPELVGKTSIFRGEQKAIYAGYLIKIETTKELHSECKLP